MRRAFRAMGLTALICAIPAATAHSIPTKIVNRINAIGIVDYSGKPTFRVGDFVRYKVINTGPGIDKPNYTLTLLIAGEEEFWGEKCFWVETWVEEPGGAKDVSASLMSYSIFDDSLAHERISLYRRKIFGGSGDAGEMQEEITRGSANLSTVRTTPIRPMGQITEPLGTDTVQTPVGLFHTTKVRIDQGKALTQTQGDSTIYLENRERRWRWIAPEVPITHIAREDTRDTEGRRAWKLGYSSEAEPLLERETSMTYARVIGFGHGEVSGVLPPERRFSLEQQAAKARATSRSAGAKRAPAAR